MNTQHWVIFVMSIGVGALISTIISALRRRFRKYYCVQELRTFDDGNRVVWTSGKFPHKYAERLKNDLADSAYRLGMDNWFKVVPYEEC